MGPDGDEEPSRPLLRTVIVDDMDDARFLLRTILDLDGRFEVVGEARDGDEAVDVCSALGPDLVVLDGQMPRMGGLEAIPLIRDRSPRSQIVFYSAALAPGARESAVAAGAVGVVEKSGPAHAIAQELSQMLVRGKRAQPHDVEVRLGPVASGAARAWIANTRKLLEALTLQPDVIGGPVAGSVMATFQQFLDAWETVARDSDYFFWTGRADPDDVRAILGEWARIDSMDDEALAMLGCSWAPPEARPFFDSLTAAIVDALGEEDDTRRLAERLGTDWTGSS